jgi:Zn-dependent membrane protease YugP
MTALVVIPLLALAAVLILPQVWVKATIRRHSRHRPDLQGTGGELARHLAAHYGIPGVKVETTKIGDHYDPTSRTIRLTDDHHDGGSISAVAIAAHEFSHALQHAHGERKMVWHQRIGVLMMWTDRFASMFFIVAPLIAVMARSPVAVAVVIGIGLALLSVRVVGTLVSLPIEYDASVRKALPILEDGRYLERKDLAAARSVLRAAALTYVAAALISLLNVARWLRGLR